MPFTARRIRSGLFAAVIVLSILAITGCQDYFASGWGRNLSGQLGNDSTTDTSVPVSVTTTGALAGKTITQVSAGYSHSCALTSAATVACWGSNSFGELGAPAGPQSQVPVAMEMTGALSGKALSAVSAGNGWTCVVTTDGMIACRGRLGNGQITGPIAGGFPVEVSVGDSHACALTTAGTVACWGNNSQGQLGDGTLTSSVAPVPVDVNGALAGKSLTRVTAGALHSCALATDGTAACWGSGARGELGNAATSDSPVPVVVQTGGMPSGEQVTQISAGQHFTCATMSDGTARCWGLNSQGQLGNPATVTQSAVPITVDSSLALPGEAITAISAGTAHACALGSNGGAACWGLQASGQLGNGVDLTTIPPDSASFVPIAVVDSLSSPLEALEAGGFHTSAINHRSGPTQFVPMTSQRVMDTRVNTPSRLAGPVEPGQRLSVDLAGLVPPGAKAVAFNVTATGQQASGYAVVTPSGVPSRASTLNWTAPRQSIANGYVVKLSGDRRVDIFLDSGGSSHFVLDVNGYFAPPGVPGGAVFTPANNRIYEFGNPDQSLGPGESRTISLDGAQIDSNSVAPTAAAVNVTVTGTTGSGVLTVAKERSTATSTINWTGANQMVANAVITDVNPDGSFTVTNSGPTSAQLVVDLTGTFTPVADGGPGAQFYPVEPSRIYDSRVSGSVLGAGQMRVHTYPIPLDSVAVAVNATATGTSGSGYLTVNPLDAVVPLSSSVNWYRSPSTVANGSIAASTGNATFAYVGGRYSTHYVIDLGGYFR